VKKAGSIFKRAKGCKAMTLQKSHENPSRYRLFVQWDTLENHTKDFRESAASRNGASWSAIASPHRRMSSM
jgi:heme-degrading monooxygenase HmoA